MVNFVIFYDHLEYFTAIAYILQPFGLVCGPLVYFPNLECLDQEKSGNPGLGAGILEYLTSSMSSFFGEVVTKLKRRPISQHDIFDLPALLLFLAETNLLLTQ
jgi:hypothetical protein